MNRRSSGARPLQRLGLGLLCLAAIGDAAVAADAPIRPQSGFPDYSEPALLTGTVYERGSNPRKILFTVRRTAHRSNATVQALIEFRTAGGTPAARERMTYEAGRLVSCQLEQLQAGSHGRVALSPEARQPRFSFEFTPAKSGRKKADSETVQPDTLVNDMITPFIRAHWDRLSNGATVRFRYAALERAETVGFKLVKDSETTCQGKPALRLKMEPASLVIAALVDPLYFTVEKQGPHRMLEYDGRVTPKIERGGKWKDLDAVTVYDWK